MWSQIVTVFCLVSVTIGLPVILHQSRVASPDVHGVSYYNYVNNGRNDHAFPSYKFAYSVFDPHTGDHKSQAEYRRGGIVKGTYSLAEPGGHMRSVQYSADDIHGFNAAVHHNTFHHNPPHHH